MIGKEVEEAMKEAVNGTEVRISEFTVAPQVNPSEGLPHHEWLVEFTTPPISLEAFAATLDKALCEQNTYYKDLIEGKVLRPLVIQPLQQGAFERYMKRMGKLGGQNKVPRLTNDREIAEAMAEEKDL